MSELWTYRVDVWTEGDDFVGYDVEALDGDIGKVDETTNDADYQHIVVDTGFWIFGKKRLIPARAITGVDHDTKRVRVNMTKDQIKDAPDFDEERRDDSEHRSGHEDYYGPFAL